MNPFTVYLDYVALKRHFTDWDYNYFTFNGKTRASPDSFDRRPDRMWFEKLERHRDPRGMLVYNLCEDPRMHVRDIVTKGEANYFKHRKVLESMSHTLKAEMKQFDPVFEKNFEGMHPRVLRLVMGKKISMETAVLFIRLTESKDYITSKFKDDVVMQDPVRTLMKYSPFVVYDEKKAREIILNFFQKELDMSTA